MVRYARARSFLSRTHHSPHASSFSSSPNPLPTTTAASLSSPLTPHHHHHHHTSSSILPRSIDPHPTLPIHQAALGEALAANRHLRTLKLKLSAAKRRDYDGTIALLQGIARNTGLRFASLPNTAINIDVARALAACVRTNTVLEHLHFARCRMPDAAAAVVAEALQDASPALFSLALDGSEITDVGATMLGQALAHRPSPNLR